MKDGNKKPRYVFKEGDFVRISKTRRQFKESYLPGWTEELFIVKPRIPKAVLVYKITEYDGTPIEGTFYAQELQHVKPSGNLFRVDPVLKRRGKGKQAEVFVAWKGYPWKYNSWVSVKHILKLNELYNRAIKRMHVNKLALFLHNMLFYLVLPRDSSLQYFPNNNSSSFTIHLPKYVHLEENDWEAALVHISYPRAWFNWTTKQSLEHPLFADFTMSSGNLPPSNYKTLREVWEGNAASIFKKRAELLLKPQNTKTIFNKNHFIHIKKIGREAEYDFDNLDLWTPLDHYLYRSTQRIRSTKYPLFSLILRWLANF